MKCTITNTKYIKCNRNKMQNINNIIFITNSIIINTLFITHCFDINILFITKINYICIIYKTISK